MSFAFALFIAAGSGFVALSYEIVWYRAYAFVSQASPAAFGMLLGAYLFGLAGGSGVAAAVCRDREPGFDSRVLRSLAWFVFSANAVSFLVVPGLGAYGAIRGDWPGSLLFVGIAAGLLGASLPLVAHFGIAPDDRAGARLSYVYLANILGSVSGSLVTGFVLFDHLTLAKVDAVLAAIGFLLALVVLGASRPSGHGRWSIAAMTAVAISLLLATPRLHASLFEKLLWGKTYAHDGPFVEIIENRHGVIAVSKDATVYGGGAYDGRFNTSLLDDRNWVIRAYGLAGMHPAPKRVLMIGLSSGSWGQIIANMPGVESLVAVEINPGYLELIAKRPEVRSLLQNPKVRVDIDDGRRWLRKHPDDRFDLIVMNTSFHFRAHMTNLLSREYLELVRTRLAAGGIMFYNTTGSRDVVKTGIETFPHALRFYNFLAVSDAPFELDKARWEPALRSWTIDKAPIFSAGEPAHEARLAEVLAVADGVHLSPVAEGIEGRESLLASHRDAVVITDDNMRSEWWSPDAPVRPFAFLGRLVGRGARRRMIRGRRAVRGTAEDVQPQHREAGCEVEGDRHAHGARLAQVREDGANAEHGRRGRTERVDEVEQADAAADVARLAHDEGDEERQGGAHQERGDQHQEEGRARSHHRRRVQQRFAGGPKKRQRDEAEDADPELDEAEDEEHGPFRVLGDPPAGEAPQSQPQHERRDDDRHRFGVDPEDGEERPLPDHLVQERGEAGDAEHQEQGKPPHPALLPRPSLPVSAGARASWRRTGMARSPQRVIGGDAATRGRPPHDSPPSSLTDLCPIREAPAFSKQRKAQARPWQESSEVGSFSVRIR